MSRKLKTVLIVLLVLVIVAALVVGISVLTHNAKYISKSEAKNIALKESGLSASEIIDVEVDFEKTAYASWYEVEIDSRTNEYDYDIDAVSGDIISSAVKTRD